MPGPGSTAHASQRCSRGAGAGVPMLRADKFTWVTFPKTMLGAGFFHKVFSLIFFSVAFEAFSKAPLFGHVDLNKTGHGSLAHDVVYSLPLLRPWAR